MLSARRVFLLTIVVVALAGGVYESQIIAHQREQLRELHARREALSVELQQLRRKKAETVTALATLPPETNAKEQNAGAAQTGAAALIEAETKIWLAQLNRLKGLLSQRPDLGIPELSLLTAREWLRIAKDAQFDTEEHIRQSLAALRNAAKEQFIGRLSLALRDYLAATNGELPPTTNALAPYLDPPVDPAIFQRYEMLHTGKISQISSLTRSIIREKAAVDEDYDSRYGLDRNGVPMNRGNNARAWIDDPDGYDGMIRRAKDEFSRANNGAKATSLEKLAPYINPPLSSTKLEKLLKLERESAQ